MDPPKRITDPPGSSYVIIGASLGEGEGNEWRITEMREGPEGTRFELVHAHASGAGVETGDLRAVAGGASRVRSVPRGWLRPW